MMAVSLHRPTRAIVSLKNIQNNYQQLKASLPHEAMVYGVVKANAYGHGAVAVAKALEKVDVDGFCVATTDEAMELRDAGIGEPVMVLGITDTDDALLNANNRVSVTISSLDWLISAIDNLPNQPEHPLLVNLKVDSGMGRIGIRTKEEGQEIINYISRHEDQVHLNSVFTHYATADSDQGRDREWVKRQSHYFENIIQELDFSALNYRPFFHRSNSALALWYPEKTQDMVRFGIGMYGSNPSNGAVALPQNVTLKPALRLETEMIYVKQMHAGEKISYGATYEAKEGEWIATLPIGYADGWSRAMTGFNVLAQGEFCPIVGRVCMDQCMIRLPHEMPIGTKVTLIGRDGDHQITAEDVAQYLDTISYEVLCAISERVPRDYKD